MLQIFYPPKGAKGVTSLADFPAPVGNVISLPANTDWLIVGEVDLQGNRIECSGICSIFGVSSETSILKSTGLADALITTQYSLPIQNLAITADLAFDIDGGGTAALDWEALNLIGCAAIGTIKNVSNFIVGKSLFINSAGCILDGTVGTISFDFSLFSFPPSGALFTVASTCIIQRRIRFAFCTMQVGVGNIGIDIIAGASIPNDMFILTDVGFSGGSLNYVRGISANDNRNRWTECRGIQNDSNSAYYFMQNNAIVTPIATTNVYVDIAGTTTAGALQRFTHSNNRADYAGVLSRSFVASAIATLTAGNTQTISMRFLVRNAANVIIATSPAIDVTTSGSGRSENIKVDFPVTLNTGDYIRAQVANQTTNNNITANDLIVIIK